MVSDFIGKLEIKFENADAITKIRDGLSAFNVTKDDTIADCVKATATYAKDRLNKEVKEYNNSAIVFQLTRTSARIGPSLALIQDIPEIPARTTKGRLIKWEGASRCPILYYRRVIPQFIKLKWGWMDEKTGKLSAGGGVGQISVIADDTGKKLRDDLVSSFKAVLNV